MKGPAALVSVSLAIVVACAGDGAAGDGSSGLRGVAFVGPQCPVEVEGSPCPDAPFAGEVRVTRGDDVVAQVSTDDQGRFEVSLDPGIYTITAVIDAGGPPSAVPQEVTVAQDRFTDVQLEVDSGIR
jgi:hypothetical protein